MKQIRTYQVKEVAAIAGVSVRTLHYYDEIGLLAPAGRTRAGYRLYDDADLFRLQQILIGRELGLSLEDIRRSLEDPGYDRRQALIRQREQLAARAEATADMIRAVDRAIALLDQNRDDKDMNIKDIFDGFDPAEHEAEAKSRWGDTDAYKESERRTRNYTAKDWKAIKDEQSGIYLAAAAAMQAGKEPDDPDVADIAERHRLSIDRWFYPCAPAAHVALADMYEADARFAANIDKYAPGLTPFLSAAIRANARRRG